MGAPKYYRPKISAEIGSGFVNRAKAIGQKPSDCLDALLRQFISGGRGAGKMRILEDEVRTALLHAKLDLVRLEQALLGLRSGMGVCTNGYNAARGAVIACSLDEISEGHRHLLGEWSRILALLDAARGEKDPW
jgi:hypothetical protein